MQATGAAGFRGVLLPLPSLPAFSLLPHPGHVTSRRPVRGDGLSQKALGLRESEKERSRANGSG